MAVDLFVYGTLIEEARVLELAGRRFDTRPATLPDYERIAPTAGYPYIRPREGASTEGVVLHDVDAGSLSAFDEYEGRLYRRQPVSALIDGQRRACEAYVGILPAIRDVFA